MGPGSGPKFREERKAAIRAELRRQIVATQRIPSPHSSVFSASPVSASHQLCHLFFCPLFLLSWTNSPRNRKEQVEDAMQLRRYLVRSLNPSYHGESTLPPLSVTLSQNENKYLPNGKDIYSSYPFP